MSKPFSTLMAANVAIAIGLSVAPAANAAVVKTTKAPTKTTMPAKKSTSPAKTSKTQTITDKTSETSSSTTGITPIAPVVVPSLANIPEPSLSTVDYPKYNTVSWHGTDIVAQNLTNVPLPTMSLSNFDMLPTVLIPQDTQNSTRLDVSILDDVIKEASPKARHYPPVFINNTDRYNTTQRIKQLSSWINNYALQPNASYDVLLRAAKINAMARNMDLGSDYAVNASNFIARALKLNDSAEANFLYGVMLAEGGGFAEGSKYLDKAEKMGYAEATQSLAQADLLDDKKQRAIQRLNDFKAKYPNDPNIDEQLRIVNNGEYYIWKLPVKPNR